MDWSRGSSPSKLDRLPFQKKGMALVVFAASASVLFRGTELFQY